MKFEVYCDESQQDLLTSTDPQEKYFLIGSLWLPSNHREEIKKNIRKCKDAYKYYIEIKWQKVTHPTLDFFKSLVDLFIESKNLRFRCIAVEAGKVDLIKYHKNDSDLGFYKFYYQALNKWILDFNEYVFFCDTKTTRNKMRLQILKECLQNSNLSSQIVGIQAVPSKESLLIQLTDLLLGAASSRINDTLAVDSVKNQLTKYLEQKLGIYRIEHTPIIEKKYNVFMINLEGGW